MRRPPAALTVLVVLVAAAVLGACNDNVSDVGEDRAAAETTPALIPFASDYTDDGDGEPANIAPADQDDESDDETDSETDETDETEPDDTEAEDTVVQIDPMPGDTATFDTRPDDDPLCVAASDVVKANEAYNRQLNRALQTSPDKPEALVAALAKLPLERIRDSYDDLAAKVPDDLRRRVMTIRDFTLEHGEELLEVENFDELSELIVEIEADPDASRVTKATLAVSKYTMEECGIRLTPGSN